MSRVAKLVYEYVIDEFIREFHQGDIETDCACTTATSPSSACVTEANSLVAKPMLSGEHCKLIG